MAVSVSSNILERGKIIGGMRMTIARLTLGSASAKTYQTGGISITPSNVGLCSVAELISMSPSVGGYVTQWDPVNKKLKLYRTAGITGNTGNASAGTPSGTVSCISSAFLGHFTDTDAYRLPAITLTHSASPGGAGTLATPLYAALGAGTGTNQTAILLSDSGVSTKGITADGSLYGVASALWFWVQHDDDAEFNGTQIYVQENQGYRLAADLSNGGFFSSPPEAYIVMPWEGGAGGSIPLAVAVKITHVEGITENANTKKLYFDDDGAAGSQLLFTATDTANHNIPSTDIVPLGFLAYSLLSGGPAAITTNAWFAGAAMGNHSHTISTSAASLVEVANGTDIGAGTLSLDVIAIGV